MPQGVLITLIEPHFSKPPAEETVTARHPIAQQPVEKQFSTERHGNRAKNYVKITSTQEGLRDYRQENSQLATRTIQCIQQMTDMLGALSAITKPRVIAQNLHPSRRSKAE